MRLYVCVCICIEELFISSSPFALTRNLCAFWLSDVPFSPERDHSPAGERWLPLLPWHGWFQGHHMCLTGPHSPFHYFYLLWAGLGSGEGSGALTRILTCITLWWRSYLGYVTSQKPSCHDSMIRLTKANHANWIFT